MAKQFGGDNDFDLSSLSDRRLPLRDPDDSFPFSKKGKQSQTCGLLDYDGYQVNEGIVPGTWFLTVTGKLSTISMSVTLRPLIYVDQPEYWGIEVTGCLPPIVLPMTGRFIETIPVTNYMGKKGIEVIGATKSDKWDKR